MTIITIHCCSIIDFGHLLYSICICSYSSLVRDIPSEMSLEFRSLNCKQVLVFNFHMILFMEVLGFLLKLKLFDD